MIGLHEEPSHIGLPGYTNLQEPCKMPHVIPTLEQFCVTQPVGVVTVQSSFHGMTRDNWGLREMTRDDWDAEG